MAPVQPEPQPYRTQYTEDQFDEVGLEISCILGAHLPADAKQPGARCPSADGFPLECPCVPDGASAKIRLLVHGMNLIVVPKRLLPSWTMEWAKVVVAEAPEKSPVLLIGHSIAIRGFQKVESYRPRKDLQHVKAQQWADAAAQNAGCLGAISKTEMAPDLPAQYCKAFEEYMTEQPDGSVNQGRFVVLTTPGSFSNHVLNPLRARSQIPYRTRKGARSRATHMNVGGVVFARVFRDEAHEERNESKTVQLFRSLTPDYQPKWMVTGTPFEKSPADIASYVRTIELEEWQNDDHLAECRTNNLQRLGNEWKRLCEQQQPQDSAFKEITDRFSRILNTLGFMQNVQFFAIFP